MSRIVRFPSSSKPKSGAVASRVARFVRKSISKSSYPPHELQSVHSDANSRSPLTTMSSIGKFKVFEPPERTS